jgi:flagellar motility protein MotE (MotC chaperone)
MYYTANQSPYKGIILTLVGIGLVLGLALIGSDLINPITSVAEFQRAQVETRRAAQQNEIDLRQYATLQEARTQAEMTKLQEENRYLQQTHDEELRRSEEERQYLQAVHEQALQNGQAQTALGLQLLRDAGYIAIPVVALSLLALSIGLSVRMAKRHLASATMSTDVWTPERKRQAIAAARWRERMLREQQAREQEQLRQAADLQERLSQLFGTHVGPDGHDDVEEMMIKPSSVVPSHN